MKRVVTLTLSLILLFCVIAVFGFRGLVSSIKQQRTCEWANIDNLELHAKIDIPEVSGWDCNFDKVSNTKRASFTIDKNKVDIDSYIISGKLQQVADVTNLDERKYLKIDKSSLQSAELYARTGLTGQHEYSILLDKLSGRLWVSIKFNDQP